MPLPRNSTPTCSTAACWPINRWHRSKPPGLAPLLTPIAANVTTASIQLRVLDARGAEVLRIQGARDKSGPVAVANPTEFAAEPAVIKVLAGEHDAVAGDRRLFLASEASQPVLFWTGAVRTAGQRIVGAVL